MTRPDPEQQRRVDRIADRDGITLGDVVMLGAILAAMVVTAMVAVVCTLTYLAALA